MASDHERRLKRAARAAGFTFVCLNCGDDGLYSLADGTVCRLCGEPAKEPFREGWDESD